ncbi:hypothetical protein BDBG_17532 [Blastomyces gilchristii SLH14081]|uniref:Uncharacterized protein n=1 Tax=Blastomyces gilchristii (strain SLH14081) TaxID=559298 RepID=A0A179UUK0_BLAGS|nr:uncharacterized protein BDBG_17532 [Blastomyces gilchristii SLH14081]OAT11473.1 hypothetical protein BDBG_17532 [Blastomyces gilchristii SLH14081]
MFQKINTKSHSRTALLNLAYLRQKDTKRYLGNSIQYITSGQL